MVAQDNATRLGAVERVLQSSAFRNSETLRRLLRYLADQAIEGTADQLKEYTIGVDAMGKPADYDPRQDSVVRIHVGRLRQKLDEYYRTEGKDDAVILELPKGHFKLEFDVRRELAPELATPIAPELPVPAEEAPAADRRGRFVPFLIAALILTSACAIWSASLLFLARRTAPADRYWNAEMRELWKPFLAPGRPLIISAAYPLFIGLQGAGFYRDPTVESLEEAQESPRVKAIRKALGNPAILARNSYTSAGDANALFSLGRIFAGGNLSVSMTKSAELTWQQLADNNVVMIGGPRFFAPLMKGLPSNLSYSLDERGIHVLHPKAGEPDQMTDHYPAIGNNEIKTSRDSGEVYALITHIPGPVGRSDTLSFSSNHNPGTLAAVDWFTNPDQARILASKIRKPNGELPQFYQLVLRVRYQDAVPTDVVLVKQAEVHTSLER